MCQAMNRNQVILVGGWRFYGSGRKGHYIGEEQTYVTGSTGVNIGCHLYANFQRKFVSSSNFHSLHHIFTLLLIFFLCNCQCFIILPFYNSWLFTFSPSHIPFHVDFHFLYPFTFILINFYLFLSLTFYLLSTSFIPSHLSSSIFAFFFLLLFLFNFHFLSHFTFLLINFDLFLSFYC
jgi:hypothetical protein